MYSVGCSYFDELLYFITRVIIYIKNMQISHFFMYYSTSSYIAVLWITLFYIIATCGAIEFNHHAPATTQHG